MFAAWPSLAQDFELPEISAFDARFQSLETRVGMLERANKKPLLSREELEGVLEVDETGEAKRKDDLARFPEISTWTGYRLKKRNKEGKIKAGLGIELFHDRDKPRKHKWKFELHFAEGYAGGGLGYILIPVVNFTVGASIGTHGDKIVYLGFYKF